MKTIKKVGIAILLIVLGTQTAFARLESLEKAPPGKAYSDGVYFTSDPRSLDLQKQIDELTAKNLELERKMNQAPTTTVVATSVSSPNDAGQTQRIEKLETRVGILESLMNGLKSAIDKTIGLLEKLIKLL